MFSSLYRRVPAARGNFLNPHDRHHGKLPCWSKPKPARTAICPSKTTTTRSCRTAWTTASISSATTPTGAVGRDQWRQRHRVDEPQAVTRYLHRYAYPDLREHRGAAARAAFGADGGHSGLQLRGEYLYVAEGSRGMRVYDAASVANKGVSERVITAPFSPLGQDTHIDSANATCGQSCGSTISPSIPRNLGEQDAALIRWFQMSPQNTAPTSQTRARA